MNNVPLNPKLPLFPVITKVTNQVKVILLHSTADIGHYTMYVNTSNWDVQASQSQSPPLQLCRQHSQTTGITKNTLYMFSVEV